MLEQRIAGADGAQVPLEQRQVGWLGLGEQQIEEPPAGARGSLDQLQILGAKHHRAQHAEIIAQAFDRLSIQRQFAFTRRPINLTSRSPWLARILSPSPRPNGERVGARGL